MRSLPLARLLLGLCLGLAVTWSAVPAADTKDDNTEKVKFNTVDGVELHGVFYPSDQGKKAPCVMLLPKIGGNTSQEGWDELARDLQKAHYAVLLFDFRGQGDSTTVSPDFWGAAGQDRALAGLTTLNRERVRGYNQANPKTSISFKDFSKAYYPVLVNDIAAAKSYLDQRNNNGDCNSSNLILIGAEDGATLGALWLYTELGLYRATQVNQFTGQPLRFDTTSEGKDVVACVWLTISPTLGSMRPWVTTWLGNASKEKVPMAFVYGEKDTTGAGFSKTCFAAAKSKSKLTGDRPIKNSKLAGNALLDSKLSAREWIVGTYLAAVKGEKVAPTWSEKDMEKSVYAWIAPGTRFPAGVKPKDEKQLPPIPYTLFLR